MSFKMNFNFLPEMSFISFRKAAILDGGGGKKKPSTFFSQWTNSGVKVDLFAHLKNTLPKEFKFFPGLLLKCSDY